MKKLCFFVLTILSCLLGLLAAACNQTLEFDYKIDFVADGKIIATVGTNGDKIAMPKNPAKWYESITPANVADKFIKQTGNDYSKIWHEHCDECYSPIDASSEDCYVSDDGFCWLCAKCFHKLKK